MPIEIRELHIKAVVGGEKKPGQSANGSSSEENDREAIVAECVAQVLDVLKQKAER